VWRCRCYYSITSPGLTPPLPQVRLIQRTLDPLKGVEQVLVNPLSRIALVTHCADACCTPSDEIATQLNNQHLGASLQSTGEANEAAAALAARPWYKNPQRVHAFAIWALFVVAVVCESQAPHAAWAVYLAGAVLGLVPIAAKAWRAARRRMLDINGLMLVAVLGALGAGEWLEGALVVVLFVSANVLEDAVLTHVAKVSASLCATRCAPPPPLPSHSLSPRPSRA